MHSLARGYEDWNDHEQLKKDPMLRLLAGKSTLNWLELSTGMTSRYKDLRYWREALDELLLDLFVESFAAARGRGRELAPVVERLRWHWPQVKIIVRADSGFCREGLLLRCEQHPRWITCWGRRGQALQSPEGRRVVAKAEYIAGKENPRFIVTSLGPESHEGSALYELLCCARGEIKNRIKDQMTLFADRMSTESFRGNQLQLYL